MTLEKLRARRETLKSQLSALDQRIAKTERFAAEAEQRELVKIIQQRGIKPAALRALLDEPAAAAGLEPAVDSQSQTQKAEAI